MSFLNEFHFIRPFWLLLAPVAICVWWLSSKWRDPLRAWRAIIDGALLEALTIGEDKRGKWRDAPLLVGWLLAVVGVAGPTWRPEPSPFADDPVPVMVVLKADESMDQEDLVPNRMERARLKVADIASQRKGQPLGLIAYAGSPHLVLPPTRDTSVVATMAEQISPAIMPKPGDDIVAALELAEKALSGSGGSLVVVADDVSGIDENGLAKVRENVRSPVYFLAIARNETPEMDSIRRAAGLLGANVVAMTPDSTDVVSLVKQTAKAPVAVADAGQGTRVAEAGWWLTPLLALLSLTTFRRVENRMLEEANA